MDVEYEKRKRIEKLAIDNIIGLGPLQQYLDNPHITEIIVQRYDNICVEQGEKCTLCRLFFQMKTICGMSSIGSCSR